MSDTRIPVAKLQKHPRAKKLLKAAQAIALFIMQDCYTGEDEDVQKLLSDALALVDQAEQLIGAREP
ncbi:MAG: hypothetical protein JWN14_34 [Chthonomonadales bacterium]|nr:hypothetical protein [Chthonomonadales bacterium]